MTNNGLITNEKLDSLRSDLKELLNLPIEEQPHGHKDTIKMIRKFLEIGERINFLKENDDKISSSELELMGSKLNIISNYFKVGKQ